MVSRIIDHLRSEGTALVLFFYFRHGEESKTSMTGLLRALLVQLLYLDGNLTEFFHQKCSPISNSELCSLPSLRHILLQALRSQKACYIVLDGLDECEQERKKLKTTSEEIIDWFMDSVVPVCHGEGGTLHLLFSGQRDGILDRRLSAVPSIGLDNTTFHTQDIRRYAEARATEIRQRFSIKKEKQASIVSKVTDGSNGTAAHTTELLQEPVLTHLQECSFTPKLC